MGKGNVKLELKDGKVTIETDYHDAFGINHSNVYEDVELMAHMKLMGINKLEGRVADCGDADSALRNAYDEKKVEMVGGKKTFNWHFG
jgi:hypothetical protein